MQQLRERSANSVRRRLLAIWESRGGGFYGFVALLTFVYLEVIDLTGDLAGLAGSGIGLGSLLSFVIGNMIDAFINGVRAAIWPVSWLGRFGVGLLSASLLAGSYVAYRAVRPHVLRLLTPSDDAPAPLIRPDIAR